MRKRWIAAILTLGLVSQLFTGCACSKKKEGLEKLGEYKGLQVYKSKTEVSDDKINQYLDTAASNHKSGDTTPEVNDEFVQKYFPYAGSTVQDLKDYYKKKLKMQQIIAEVWPKVIQNSEVASYNKEELNDLETKMVDYYESIYYQEYQTDLDSYLESVSKKRSDWDKDLDESAKDSLKAKMVVEAIAEKEGIKVTDEEYEKQADILAKENGYSDVKQLESSNNGKDNVKYNILSEKVYQMITDNVKVVDDPATSETVSETTASVEAATEP